MGPEDTHESTDAILEASVAAAASGDRAALEDVVRAVQRDVFRLATRFLWHPEDAEDATQEILIRVVTALGTFAGKSRFRTWVYRIACNHLLTQKKKRMEQRAMSLDDFGEDLKRVDWDAALETRHEVDEELLAEEVRIGCTLAMLQGLDRPHRVAYILGEIMELGHKDASKVLDITPAAFRKRLSRARDRIVSFMRSHCGVIESRNPCRCKTRIPTAISLGRVDPGRLLFASRSQVSAGAPDVVKEVRRLEKAQRVAALFRAHSGPTPTDAFIAWLGTLIDRSM